ncbi:MAG TPA: hypothetical protein VFB62_13680 [Polyangiaceae bacterium]|jgi:hypothetical protein|nr:hypothetical protein [Polyangiaceae bacterium]
MRRLLTLLALFSLAACEQDYNPPFAIPCPPLDVEETTVEEFSQVSSLLEKRCGTLDCHGSLYRPFKLYGKDGLRNFLPEEYSDPELAQANMTFAGGLPTTVEELDLNRRSICGLEPEKMGAAMAGEIEVTELLFLQKPLGDIDCTGREDEGCARHKGGQVFIGKGADDTVCVKGWIVPPFDNGACSTAIAVD